MNPKDIVEPDQYELFGAVDLGDEAGSFTF